MAFTSAAEARQYLVQTGRGNGNAASISKLNPNYAINLANAVQEARSRGMNVGVFSAFRTPGQLGSKSQAGRFDATGSSLHSYGLATDIYGVDPPGRHGPSASAQQWYKIATAHGIYNPYGTSNRKEYNHYQGVPDKSAPQALRGTLNANGTPKLDASGAPVFWARAETLTGHPVPPADIPGVAVAGRPYMFGLQGNRGDVNPAMRAYAASRGYNYVPVGAPGATRAEQTAALLKATQNDPNAAVVAFSQGGYAARDAVKQGAHFKEAMIIGAPGVEGQFPGVDAQFVPQMAGVDHMALPAAVAKQYGGQSPAYTGGPPLPAAQQAAADLAAGRIPGGPPPLRKGATDARTGGAVSQLQRQLADAGLYKGKVDGSYGPQTAAAVSAAEKQYGLPTRERVGVAGPQVQAALANQASTNNIMSVAKIPGVGMGGPAVPDANPQDIAFGRVPGGVPDFSIANPGPPGQRLVPTVSVGPDPILANQDPFGRPMQGTPYTGTRGQSGGLPVTMRQQTAAGLGVNPWSANSADVSGYEPGPQPLDYTPGQLADYAKPPITMKQQTAAGLGINPWSANSADVSGYTAPPANVGAIAAYDGSQRYPWARDMPLAPSSAPATTAPVSLNDVWAGTKRIPRALGDVAGAAGGAASDASAWLNQQLFGSSPPVRAATPLPPPAVSPGGSYVDDHYGAGLSARPYPSGVPYRPPAQRQSYYTPPSGLSGMAQTASSDGGFVPSGPMSSGGLPQDQTIGRLLGQEQFHSTPDLMNRGGYIREDMGNRNNPSNNMPRDEYQQLGPRGYQPRGVQIAGSGSTDHLRGAAGADMSVPGGVVTSPGVVTMPQGWMSGPLQPGGFAPAGSQTIAPAGSKVGGAGIPWAGAAPAVSIDDTGYPDTGVGQPAGVAARGGIGAVNYQRPLTTGQQIGRAGLSMVPGIGALLSVIAGSAFRGSFDNAQPYTGGPVNYNSLGYQGANMTPYGTRQYTTPSGGFSNSMFTPSGSGWQAPNFTHGSGGSLYATNPETHQYTDSQGRLHSY